MFPSEFEVLEQVIYRYVQFGREVVHLVFVYKEFTTGFCVRVCYVVGHGFCWRGGFSTMGGLVGVVGLLL